MKKMCLKFNFLLITSLIISTVSAINRNISVFNKVSNKSKNSEKLIEARGHEPWGYLDGYGHGDMGAYGKSDYYWLIPLVIVIGFGALLLPLLGTLMTTMITQGTINLTAGRRKREAENVSGWLNSKGISNYLIPLLVKVEDALNNFDQRIKSEVSPLMTKLNQQKPQ